ncbi:MAG: FAD-dependent oxidoreductase [Chloroflexi bacterium]|nr:FAD-dependent oxidoreductase [Chloroflexota bacterium]
MTDVVIVGGGIVGCAAAYFLAKHRVDVMLLERNGIGSGASGRSGGGVRQSARVSAEISLAVESVVLFPTLSDELGVDIEYVQRGNLRLVETVDHIRPMQVDIKRQQSQGLDVCWLGQAETCEMVPALRRESVFGASFCPTDGHSNPLKLTSGFAQAASKLGARFITGCQVRNIRQTDSGSAVIETTRGEMQARTVIIAAGAGTRALCLNLGFDLPLANMRYESLVTEATAPLFQQMFGVGAADLFFRQTKHGGVHFGGGLIEQAENEATTSKNLQLAAEHLVRLVPFLENVNLVRTWGGLDPSTPDGIPIIDRLNENVLVASGFCGHGFALGPVIGRHLAEWVVSGDKPQAFDAFRRNRFGALLQTKWTPSGSFEAALAVESKQVVGASKTASIQIESEEEAVGNRLLVIDAELCTGCRMCEMACSIHHYQLARPTQLRIKVAYESDHSFSPVPCIHCPEAHCLAACAFDALVRDEALGIIRVIDENCTSCMLCIEACSYGGITYADDKSCVIKCDLCNGEPACAAYCAPGAIRFRVPTGSMMERMKTNASEKSKLLVQGIK